MIVLIMFFSIDTLKLIPLWSKEQMTRPEYQIGMVSDMEVYKGRIYIVDKQFSRVAVFDTTGKYIMDIGAPGQGPGEFTYPSDLEIYNDTVYLSDNGNGRMNVYNLRGDFLFAFPGIYSNEIEISEKRIFLFYGLKDKLVEVYDRLTGRLIDSIGEGFKVPGRRRNSRHWAEEQSFNHGFLEVVGDTVYFFFDAVRIKGKFLKVYEKQGEIFTLQRNLSFDIRFRNYTVKEKQEELKNHLWYRLFSDAKICDGRIYVFSTYIEIFDRNGRYIKTILPRMGNVSSIIFKFAVDRSQRIWGIEDKNLYKLVK